MFCFFFTAEFHTCLVEKFFFHVKCPQLVGDSFLRMTTSVLYAIGNVAPNASLSSFHEIGLRSSRRLFRSYFKFRQIPPIWLWSAVLKHRWQNWAVSAIPSLNCFAKCDVDFARYLHEVPLRLNPKSGWFLGANEKKNVSLSALYRFISRRLFFPVKISSFALFSSSNVQWLHFQSSASVANVPSSANISFRKVFFS